MKLRRLRVAGFKTFARSTEVTFERGITAIVGPNGSGKSNLVDAVRWALGETNARELRGQRMDEVIYAGGGGRARLGMAEVDLVLDNEDRVLALDDPEVALSRRVLRGAGDTEYRVNGDRVRLRDLERLLTATGLTQSGYAVVAQNDIDAIIEASPAHRRMLVEQAAGVRHLRAAADEALNRTARAEAVTRRLDDLLDDAEPRLQELAGQVELALEQRGLATRLGELRGSLAREEWRAARGRLRQAQRSAQQAAGRLEAAAEADRAFAGRIEAQRSSLHTARAAAGAAAEALEAARLAAERAVGERRRWADRLRAAVLQRGAAAAELRAAEDETAGAARAAGVRLALLEEELAVRTAACGDAAAQLTEAEQAVRQARDAAEDSRRRRREAEARSASLREATAGLIARAAALRGSLSGAAGGEGGVARAVASGGLRARRLWDCFSVPDSRDEAAVEAALEAYLGAWLVEDLDAATRHLNPDGPREQLLLIKGVEEAAAPDLPGRPLVAAVLAEPDAAGALAACSRGVRLVADQGAARHALAAGASAAVLPDGTLVSPAGVRGGGRPGRVLRMAADERRLEQELQRARAEEAAAMAAIATAHGQAAASEAALAMAAEAARASAGIAAEAEALAAAARRAMDAAQRGDDESRRLLEAARTRGFAAELRLLAAETDAASALVHLEASDRAGARSVHLVRTAGAAAAEAAAPVQAMERTLLALEAERSQVAVALARAEDEHTLALRESAAAQAQVDELAGAAFEEADDDAAELEPVALDRAEREIVRLERRVAGMGPVNALAPEQHAELSARISTLQRDRADLAVATDDIRDLASWLTVQVDERFEAVFGAVSFHFHQLFSELFPGGKAALRLEEPEPPEPVEGDEPPAEAHPPGVEILAQPPGKRLGPLRLLSGGERALTALAVILALQHVNPSPFYVFDEVDAALDDTNVLRFVRLLQRLAAEQQFIVVTHNHITMAAADSLWGVTIDAAGVSTVIGVRFDEHAGVQSAETAQPRPVIVRAG